MSTGGTSIDRTIEAHPDNVEIAETAARIVGLDVAGIDFICPDIATPVLAAPRPLMLRLRSVTFTPAVAMVIALPLDAAMPAKKPGLPMSDSDLVMVIAP